MSWHDIPVFYVDDGDLKEKEPRLFSLTEVVLLEVIKPIIEELEETVASYEIKEDDAMRNKVYREGKWPIRRAPL